MFVRFWIVHRFYVCCWVVFVFLFCFFLVSLSPISLSVSLSLSLILQIDMKHFLFQFITHYCNEFVWFTRTDVKRFHFFYLITAHVKVFLKFSAIFVGFFLFFLSFTFCFCFVFNLFNLLHKILPQTSQYSWLKAWQIYKSIEHLHA